MTAVERLVRAVGRVPAHRALRHREAARPCRSVGRRPPGSRRGDLRRTGAARWRSVVSHDAEAVRARGWLPRAMPWKRRGWPRTPGLGRGWSSELRRPLARNRSTLVFANSRRMVEKVTRLVNENSRTQLVYSHHGSLSREVRAVVEERLKKGELRGIVATNSLELGIDIGALDEVVLVQTPPSLASAVQRIGRAGHAVGETSRGTLPAAVPARPAAAAVVWRGPCSRARSSRRGPWRARSTCWRRSSSR